MTLASESLPLSGLKVLSVEFYGAGPFCTQYLSTFGADVIKIENSTQGGDFARTTGPNSLGPEDSLYFQSFNQGKRSLSLDLKDIKGKEVLHRLVAKSEGVILENDTGCVFRSEYTPCIILQDYTLGFCNQPMKNLFPFYIF